MSRQEKFSFIPASQLTSVAPEMGGVRVSVSGSQSAMNFMRNEETEKYVGKYIKFYIDEKKRTLAWRFFTEGDNLSTMADMVQIKNAKVGKYFQIKAYLGVGLCRALKVDAKKTYSGLKVQRYQPVGMLVEKSEYHYVTITDSKKHEKSQ